METDEELIRLMKKNPQGAEFARAAGIFMDRYGHRLVAFLARFCKPDEIADAAHDGWLRAFEKLDYFRDGKFFAWLCTITHNEYVSEKRRRRPQPLADAFVLTSREKEPIQALLDTEKIERLRRCIEELPPDQKDAVLAKLGKVKLAIDPNLRDSRFHQAKKRLQKCMDHDA